MNIHCRPALVSLLLVCALAAPAAARINPYVRLDFGGGDLKMTDVDNMIMANQAALQNAGYAARFQKVGSSYGPGASVGLWLTPAFRVGATYSFDRARRVNSFHSADTTFFFEQDVDLRMNNFGAEAAVRFDKLQGLILGVNVGEGRAEMLEALSTEQLDGSKSYVNEKAKRTKPTYGVFIGLDQTNPDGVAGYVRVGFQYRDVGHMPGSFTVSDGVTITPGTGETIWMDYSGFYAKVGIGFDRIH